VEELDRFVASIQLRETGAGELLEVILANKTDDVIQQEDAVNGGESRALERVPFLEELRDRAQQFMRRARVGFKRHQELRGAHQEGGYVERATRN